MFEFEKLTDFFEPVDPTFISCINPPEEFRNSISASVGIWAGTVVYNSKIYAVPLFGTSLAYLLEFDPTTTTTSNPKLIKFTNSSYERWDSAVLAPNGKIYAVPSSGANPSHLLEFRRTFPQIMNDWILYPQFYKF